MSAIERAVLEASAQLLGAAAAGDAPAQAAKVGRSNEPLGQRWLRMGVQTVERVSPRWAARITAHLMFRTRRRPLNGKERALLESGTALDLGSKLAARSWGRGPVVLAVHGWNGRSSQFGAFVAALTRAGYRVVAFDVRGHGASPGASSSIVEFADAFEHAVRALTALGESVCGVVAHSLGASGVTVALSRWQRAANASAAVTRLAPMRLVFIAPPTDVRDWVQAFERALGLSPRTRRELQSIAEARIGERFEQLYAPELARSLDAPLLIFHDAEDRAVPVASGRSLAAAWPGAELRVTQGLGHVRILSEPEIVGAAVEFLQGRKSETRGASSPRAGD
jgi:pimeloyl-ACP methyl ester carboxylesterase